jgi:2-keto-4-pentenoate hydratase/2-oxohepta-3-ene-1,7-dioic acid hydratase in catechol pathway
MYLPIFGRSENYEIRPSKIIALGLNYHEHIQESESVRVRGFTKEAPPEPVLFPKTPNAIIGPGDPIIIPKFLLDYHFENLRIDYEAELALIIKDCCKNIPPGKVKEHILGYTALNDVSQRNIQNSDRSGWFRGKSLDTFCPIGPQIVLQEDIGDPQHLRIQCRLNGKTVQDSNTSYMIFSIPDMVSFISKNFTLEPGDIISTGTPSGVGPIHHGDIVEVELEKIGILKNPVVEEWML